MHTVNTTFTIQFTDEQHAKAVEYVEDMKRHPKRVYWLGKAGKSDEELVYAHIAHKVLSGFYNNYDPSYARRQIVDMSNQTSN